jgi:gluconate kinase
LFKNRHREKVLLAVPDLSFVWVRSTPVLISKRLQERTGHLASAYYGEVVNPGFESPTIPHDSIENAEDDAILELRIAELVARIRPNQSLEPMARYVTPRACARVAPALAMAHH